jgi:hypothetical protein
LVLSEEIMKKIGILIFIIAIVVGVAVANVLSFGKASGNIFTFSFGSKIEGSGNPLRAVREVSGFTGVDVGGIFEVEITAGKEYSVQVHADDNLLPYIRTEVDGGVLQIATTQRISSHTPLRVVVSAPEIEHVDVSGVSKVFLSGVRNSELGIHTSGASKLKLEGETSELTVEVSGASNIDAASLRSKNASVEASGASKVSVFVTERLRSEASGASKIQYEGNPSNVEKRSSGASSVHQK